MSWWRKNGPGEDSVSENGWIQIKSIWRKASPQDEANSNESQNPWVIDGWLKIKSAWRLDSIVNGVRNWVRIFSGTNLPTPKIPYTELYYIWPDGFETIDSPINGSSMYVTRGSWTEEPEEFRLRIQELAPGGTWSALYDFTKIYEEYLESQSTNKFPSDANAASRPVISKTKTRQGYKFRGRVDAKTPGGLENFYITPESMPRIDFYIADFIVYDEEADGATFSWSYAALATGNTVDDNLDIFSQKLNV